MAEVQAGNNNRIDELWEQVEGLVKWKAKHVMYALELQGNCRGLEFEDLVQTGFLAMLEALQTFKPENGLFSTWLMFYLQSAFSEVSGYRTKRKRSDPINATMSLDLPFSAESDAATLHEIIPDPSAEAALEAVEDKIWHEQLSEALEDLLAELPEKSRNVLLLRYYQNLTLSAVGDVFRVGAEMARQIELQALRVLRKPCNLRRLQPFHDFNVYFGTGLGAYKATGLTVQERYLIRREEQAAKETQAVSIDDQHISPARAPGVLWE